MFGAIMPDTICRDTCTHMDFTPVSMNNQVKQYLPQNLVATPELTEAPRLKTKAVHNDN